jgi:methyltransferase (TIGR00027 family)
VGRFSDPCARELLDPSERAVVDGVRAAAVPTGAGERMAYELVRRTGVTMVPRTVAIDDAIRSHGASQVAIVGAGLDARAWRMRELTRADVFEVDHPASQEEKRRRVGDLAPLARRVVWVPVDLASDRLGAALEAAGFDRRSGTTWVWEGVVPYLSAEEVSSTVAQVAELSAPDSRLVVNYQMKSLPTSVMRAVMRLVLRIARQPDPLRGEPWRSKWRPDQMRKMLSDNGFRVIHDSSLLALAEGMDLAPGSNGSLRNGRVAIAVRLA